jgi:uridine kinase
MRRVIPQVRRRLLREVAGLVEVERPVLMAVDGPDGAGKTCFADELATVLAGAGHTVVRAGVDDFHHPRSHRHAEGRTGRTVWERSFDYRALRRELLDPWLAGEGAAYRLRWHDLLSDEHVDAPLEVVPARGVLVVDGVFVQRPELAQVWDLVVYLDVPAAVCVDRLAARDGGPADPDHPDRARYLEALRIYRAVADPRAAADLVVDNADLAAPSVAAEPAAPCPACGRPLG